LTVSAGSGVTLNAYDGTKSIGRYAGVQLVHLGSNSWRLYGGVA
jgi:hypothetical protein